MFKRIIIAAMTFVAMLSFVLNVEAADNNRNGDNWLIYIYMCGTNLEETLHKIPVQGENGATQIVRITQGQASRNISQMEKVKLPPNVRVLIRECW